MKDDLRKQEFATYMLLYGWIVKEITKKLGKEGETQCNDYDNDLTVKRKNHEQQA